MSRFLVMATALLMPALTYACPLQRHHCQPGAVIVYPPQTCCLQLQRVHIVPIVDVKPAMPKTPVAKPDPELEKWATVKGRIVWDKEKNGEAPKRVRLVATKDAEVAAKDGEFWNEDWVVNQNNLGIQNVVVWVVPELTKEDEITALKKAMDANKSFPFASFKQDDIDPKLRVPSSPRVTLDIPYLRFAPHILAAREGQNLVITNRTPVPHNPKWVSRNNGEFTPLVPAGGQFKLDEPLKAERFPIEVSCSIHPWMKAYVRVFDHPYFAVTDFNGNFEIKDIPRLKGKVRMFIWQENGLHRGAAGRFGQTVELKLGTTDLKEIKFDTASRPKK